MIEVKNLKKSYGDLQAVKGVDFSISKGEIVGLLGPNGAGKTTIMKILTGYMFPSDGIALVGDINVVERPVEVKKLVGYLPENTPLYNDLNVLEYLSFIAEAHGLKEQKREDRIVEVSKECGLSKVIMRNISELSKGYRQRVGLAQAMLHDPPILILDEPTTGLDPNQILEIRELIKKLGQEKTVILSTHIMQEVEAVCNKVLILNEGYIVAKGTTEEIARKLHGEDILNLTLKAQDAQAVSQALSICPVVDKVISAEQEGTNRLVVRLALKKGLTLPEEAIFDWAVASGNKILAMLPERLSLEDIFAKLTREGQSNVG